METLLHSETPRLYSWWWDSHISPRNSKWLQENLTDMDTKVKAMIKLIEEDADSFARRAEMYYEKRPELLKMVEQFYRAYRALAERYDHMTGELRQAHCTIAQAFPSQLHLAANEDSPSISSAPNTGFHTPDDVPQPSEVAELAKHIELISELEDMISHAEENTEGLTITGLKAENEAEYLSHEITRLESEGKDGSLNCNLCLEKISYPDEHLGRNQVEAMLQNLPGDHFRAQEDHEALVLELKAQLKMLKRSEQCKSELEDEIRYVKDENHKLHDEKAISTISIDSLQNEILALRKIKETLEEEAAQQTAKTNSLQTEIFSLRQELEALNKRYQLPVQKLESERVDNDMVGSSIKNSPDHETESVKKVVISEKLQDMKELSKKKILQESSLSQLHGELEASREEVRELRYTSQFLRGANFVLNSEKTTLQAQLKTLTENMQVVLDRNAVIENSLSCAKIELEGQKEKSKGLEEICGLLKNEKFDLLTRRDTLLVQLANAEGRSERLEKRLAWLEEMCANLKKENKNVKFDVEELALSLNSEKHERINSTCHYETRLVSVEHHIHLLEEESRWRKQVCEDELAKAAKAQFELFILKKFLEDAVDKNYSLLTECEKHVEASKLAEKLNYELRNQNLEQQIEAESLLDEIERLRFGLYRVFKASEADSNKVREDKIESERMLVNEIVGNIDHIRQSNTKYKDDSELLKVENLVLLTLIQQMQIEDAEIETKKELVELELSFTTEKLVKLQNENCRLVQMNDSLKSEFNKAKQEITLHQVGLEILCVKQGEMERAYMHLQENYFSMLDEIKYVHKKCSEHEEENCMLKGENEVLLQERFALVTVTTVLEGFSCEEQFELETLHGELYKMSGIKAELANDMNTLRGKLEMKEEQNIFLKDLVQRYEMELLDLKDVLSQREVDLLEAEGNFKREEGLNLELSKSLVEQKTEFEETLLEKQTLENQVLKLSEVKRIQQTEIEDLLDMNANLMSELCKLHEVCEEHRRKEQKLHTQLKAESYEFELLNSEATELCFDLQISSIQEVIYENVVRDITQLCGNLEGENFSRTFEIQQLKEKISLIDSEMGELRAELSKYTTVIASFRDDVASLEHNLLLKLKLEVLYTSETKSPEALVETSIHCQDEPVGNQFFTSTDIETLQNLQGRIRAFEKAFVQEIKKPVTRENLKAKGSRETARNEINEITIEGGQAHGELRGKEGTGIDPKNSMKFRNVKPEATSLRKGTSIKDDPLDHVLDPSSYRWCRKANISIERADDKMLELWEAAETSGLKQGTRVRRKPSFAARKRTLLSDQSENTGWKFEHHPSMIFEAEKKLSIDTLIFEAEKKLSIDTLEFSSNLTESVQEVNNQKIHDRIASNARKLKSLELIVENLNRRLGANKKSCKSKNTDLEMVEQQLLQVQGSVFQLVEFNDRLIRNIEESSCYSDCQFSGEQEEVASLRRKKSLEQARMGSGKIGQLQLEVQKLENMLTKLENRRKSKGRSRLSRNGTTVILRDVIYDEKNIGKKKKAHLCGCFRPTSNGKPRKM